MINEDALKELIAETVPCEHIEISGDGRHWFATIVSSSFEGLNAVARHRAVYAALGQRLHTDEVHALSMQTLTPAEWSKSIG